MQKNGNKVYNVARTTSVFENYDKIVSWRGDAAGMPQKKTMMKYLGTIIDSGILSELRKSEYMQAFEELSVIGQNMRKDDVLFHEGDEVNKICIIARGSIRGEKAYPSGELHIIQILDEGSIFGTEAAVSKKKTAPMDYICNEDSTVVFISLKSIDSSRFSRQIYQVLMQQLADDNIKKMVKIEILAEKSLRKRIMLYFGVLRKKSGTDVINVKMNREQLAQYLGVNRSALSSELNKMKREKIIDFEKERFKIL